LPKKHPIATGYYPVNDAIISFSDLLFRIKILFNELKIKN